MKHFNFNGKLFSENEKVIGPQSRALRYGDGLFETIKYRGGNFVLFDEHYVRMISGMKLLGIDVPKLWSAQKFEEQVGSLAAKNGLPDARIRINIFRGEGGLYDAESNQPNYIIEATELPVSTGTLNENGLRLCVFEGARKAADQYSAIKSNNALPYIMGAQYAKQQQCNDAVILNAEGRVCETTIANIFIINNGIVKTPAISEGCIAGIMRGWLIRTLREEGYTVEESAVSIDELMAADEIFLSNSIYNIRRVAKLAGKAFESNECMKIFNLLQKKYPDIIC